MWSSAGALATATATASGISESNMDMCMGNFASDKSDIGPSNCEKYVSNLHDLRIAKTMLYSLSIKETKIYIISHNSFFKMGIISFVENLYNQRTNTDIINNITIDSLNLKEVTDLINKNDISSCVFIADKDIKDTLSLYLSYEMNCHATLFCSSDVTKDSLTAIIKSKNHLSHCKIPTPPRYTLLGGLSHREKRVCNYIYLGYSPKLIGLILGIHPKSVSGYKTRIMKKIGCIKKSDFNSAIISYNRLCKDESLN